MTDASLIITGERGLPLSPLGDRDSSSERVDIHTLAKYRRFANGLNPRAAMKFPQLNSTVSISVSRFCRYTYGQYPIVGDSAHTVHTRAHWPPGGCCRCVVSELVADGSPAGRRLRLRQGTRKSPITSPHSPPPAAPGAPSIPSLSARPSLLSIGALSMDRSAAVLSRTIHRSVSASIVDVSMPRVFFAYGIAASHLSRGKDEGTDRRTPCSDLSRPDGAANCPSTQWKAGTLVPRTRAAFKNFHYIHDQCPIQ